MGSPAVPAGRGNWRRPDAPHGASSAPSAPARPARRPGLLALCAAALLLAALPAALSQSSSSSSATGSRTGSSTGTSSASATGSSAATSSAASAASQTGSAQPTRTPIGSPPSLAAPFPLQVDTSQRPNCTSINAACPASAPCCRDGWCDSSPYFCGVHCEPLNSFSIRSCYARYPCFSYTDDFDNRTRLVKASDWDGDPLTAEWISIFEPNHAEIKDGHLVMRVFRAPGLNSFGRPEGFGASVASSRWIQYGYITASIRTARGGGIVTAFITRGSDGAPDMVEDEIDFEAVGKNLKGVYTNYFSYGDLVYNHGSTDDFTEDTSAGFHTYRIVWMPDYIQWIVDNRVLRTTYKNTTWDEGCRCYKYPTREARIAFSIWDGGMGAEGTAWWAGGPTDWSRDDNPDYTMEVDWVDIGCYYKGNNSIVFSGRNSSLLASRTTATASTSTRWTVRPAATYVNGGRLDPGMNGTNGTLVLVMPDRTAGAGPVGTGAAWAALLGVVVAVLAMLMGNA
ncbi:concanavalin A-like lectin/glucanase domain-containing protein [Hyaloraphidium curvatum]|nr:concanavalin A-like lectin/glucanase domain-containing protein [Hyaloraphidium curvatum]